MDEKTQGNVTFQRTVFGSSDAPLRLFNDDGVATLVVGLPERLGPIAARTYWRMSFEFEPPRQLTPAEREAMKDAVTSAANAFLKSLPEDLPPAAPVTVSTIGFTTERIVRVSPVPAGAARAPEGATFTIEDDGQRYLGVPARIVNGAVEFVVSRAAMRTALEEPQGGTSCPIFLSGSGFIHGCISPRVRYEPPAPADPHDHRVTRPMTTDPRSTEELEREWSPVDREINDALGAPRWHEIDTEGFPDAPDGAWFLIYCPAREPEVQQAQLRSGGVWDLMDREYSEPAYAYDATHWHPLPARPMKESR